MNCQPIIYTFIRILIEQELQESSINRLQLKPKSKKEFCHN
jgi:hypothetical protein